MYTPLKVITDYSLLKSLIKVKDLINFCVKRKIKSCAICDTNLSGSIEFYNLCLQNNIKPIIGLNITLNNSDVYLYAKDYDGYRNLLKINTIICESEITLEELKKYSSNLICIIPFKSKILYRELSFISDLYLGYKNKEELKNSLLISKKVVYVNSIRAFNKNDLKYMKYLDKLREEDIKEYENEYYDSILLDEFDKKELNKFTDLINLEMPKGNRYIPIYNKDIDSFKLLYSLCIKGLNKRLNNKVSEEYINRLKYELNVIKKMGFVDYFLIVYDYVLYAKKNNILVGPGRGSAAGSLVSYVIGITDIDPIKYDLLFERFLNYERVSMPDIDIDFENDKREKVIDYVREKYGVNNVSPGITFATYKAKLVIRDVCKLLKVDDRLINKFVKVINRNLSLKDNLKREEVKEYLNNYSELKKVYDISMHLEDLKRNVSTHAAGIVIADRPLDEIIPMYKKDDTYLTGIEMPYLEDLGLLKMDFLALKNLTTISNIISKIPNFKLSEIPLNDKITYELFCRADTEGIFQFETISFKNMLKKYRPHNFSELVALIALNRPGPYKELETYIKRKDKLEEISYYDESLKDILSETYGVIVYQEQVINILVKMGNFSYAEADNIRRAMSKKKEDVLIKWKDEFIKRSIKNGYDKDLAVNIYEHILSFAAYGFNKAHSVSYALVSYEMAYLKAHYLPLFTFELLNNSLGNNENIKKYIFELKKCNYIINKVSINYSSNNFILKDKYIFLPFKLIKNIKIDIINNIIEERNRNGLFKDIFDFFKRTSKFISKSDYLILINAGVLRELKVNIKSLTTNLDTLINYGNLYNDLGEDALIPELIKEEEYDVDTLRNNEITCYGFYISNHPSSKYSSKEVVKLNVIRNYEFKNVVCYCLVENISKIKTKKGEDMAFISVSDDTGNIDLTVFPKNYNLLQNINKNDMIKIWGNVSKRYDKVSIIVNNLRKE